MPLTDAMANFSYAIAFAQAFPYINLWGGEAR